MISASRETRIENFFVSESSWLKGASYNLTGDVDTAMDLVSVTFTKILSLSQDRFNKITYGDNTLNQYFFYRTMKNTYLNQIRDDKMDYDDSYDIQIVMDEESNEEFELLQKDLTDDINQYLDYLETKEDTWFNAKLFRLYVDSGKSMETIAKETTISKSVVWSTVKKMRLHLLDKFGDRYEQLNDL